MRRIIILVLIFFSIKSFSQNQQKINVILIGTYHFNNPGFDQGKVQERNILTEENQKGLERITNKIIKKYKPSKVFVESDFEKRNNLNQLYQLYNNEKEYYDNDTLNSFYKRYYSENEIFQLGFRLANKAGNDSIYSIDYDKIPIRFDLLMQKIETNPKFSLGDYKKDILKLESFMNKCLSDKKLENVLKCLNSIEQYQLNKGSYISFLNRINNETDFFGSDLVSLWYKRNLIMYANIQNQVNNKDKNIVVIVGAGHAAMLEEFIKLDSMFNLIKVDELF